MPSVKEPRILAASHPLRFQIIPGFPLIQMWPAAPKNYRHATLRKWIRQCLVIGFSWCRSTGNPTSFQFLAVSPCPSPSEESLDTECNSGLHWDPVQDWTLIFPTPDCVLRTVKALQSCLGFHCNPAKRESTQEVKTRTGVYVSSCHKRGSGGVLAQFCWSDRS